MKILFLGGFYLEELKEVIKADLKNTSLQIAPDVYQKSFINGLVANKVCFDAYSLPFTPCYPFRFKRIKLPFHEKKLPYGSLVKSLSFSSLVFYKYISQYNVLLKEIETWCEMNDKEKELLILSYSTEPIPLLAVEKIKKKYPELKSAVIITDMIEDAANFSGNRGVLKKIQLKIDSCLIRNAYDTIDYYVLLTEYMKERIPQIADNYCVIEGISSVRETKNICIDKYSNPTLLYSGSLDSYSNVDILVRAFRKTANPKFRLIICGVGYYASYIIEEMKKDSRISYKGFWGHEDIVELQKQSTLLINPRRPSEITRYSFPSKTIEYMLSGTPVLLYKLPGIPEEYYNYCFAMEDFSEEALSNEISRILCLEDETLLKVSEKAYSFILSEKNEKKQVECFLNMIGYADSFSDKY